MCVKRLQENGDKRIKELNKETVYSLISSLGVKIDEDQRKRPPASLVVVGGGFLVVFGGF